MTNPIGSGTVNITINVPAGERGFWSQLVDALGFRSAGELQRLALERGLAALASDFQVRNKPEAAAKAAEAARELCNIRRQFYGTAMLAIIFAMLACDQDVIRAARKTTRERNEVEFSLEV